jgi:hypothetical protein
MINGHLTAVEAEAHPKVRDWEISTEGFKAFMRGWLSDLRQQLDSDSGKMAITKKYGAETYADLFDFYAHFE